MKSPFNKIHQSTHNSIENLIKKPLFFGLIVSIISLFLYGITALMFDVLTKVGLLLSFVFPIAIATPITFYIKKIFKLLDEKNKKINVQNAELEEIFKSRDELLRLLVHDIKGPINNLQSSLEFIKEKEIEFDFFIDEMVPEIEEKIKKTNLLIEEFIEWAVFQGNKSKINLVRINIYDVLMDVVENFNTQIQQKKLTLKIDENCNGCFALGDEKMLRAVFRNLISNAIKFSFDSTTIEIKVTKAKGLEIEVKDFGVGMPQQKINSILNSDELITSTLGTNFEKGTGLGLRLVKRLLEHQQGKLDLKSEENLGTSAKIILLAA